MTATVANIEHLQDVKNSTCKSSPKTCTRVAFEGMSGIFFCNDVSVIQDQDTFILADPHGN